MLTIVFRKLLACTAVLSLSGLVACGGGRDEASTQPTHTLASATVAGYPHAIDVYGPVGATQAIVMLHGGAGSKSGVAYQLGLNSSPSAVTVNTANWDWLSANKVMMVFPQGQHIGSEPDASTWSNHVMTSGQDDVAFLQALVVQLKSNYPGLSRITLMGHSNGGMMVNRMWCESPGTFDAYVSVAGPASTWYQNPDHACSPALVKPYLGLVGDSDTVLQTTGDWTGPTWTVRPSLVLSSLDAWVSDPALLIAEWPQQQVRADMKCGSMPSLESFSHAGNVDTWSSCGGQMVLKRVLGSDHELSAIETRLGAGTTPSVNLMDAVMGYLAGL